MSALIQSFSSLSLSSRTLRGDAKVASPSTRAMPKNRTAVVTEAVRCAFSFFFWAPNFFCILPSSSSSSSSSSWCYYHGRKRKRANYRENRLAGLSFFYASEIVLRSIPSRDDVFVRRVGGGGRRRSRAKFFFALKKFYPRWREVFLRSLQVFAAKKTSLFCVCQRQKIY